MCESRRWQKSCKQVSCFKKVNPELSISQPSRDVKEEIIDTHLEVREVKGEVLDLGIINILIAIKSI